MHFNRFALAGLTAALAAVAACPAAAAMTPQFLAQIHGTQVGPDVLPTFDADEQSASQIVTSGMTKSNFTVGASASPANGGTLSATVQLAPLDGYSAPDHAVTLMAEASAIYYFTIAPINGGAGVDPLDVHIQAGGSIAWNNSGAATASFQVTNYNSYATVVNDYVSVNAHGANTYLQGSDGFTTDGDFTLYSNTIYSVSMDALAKADARSFDYDSYGEEYASVDPIFTLLGANASQYAFVGVPGQASPPPPPPILGGVPEPASWALMLLGFGGLGARLRARRRPGFQTASGRAA